MILFTYNNKTYKLFDHASISDRFKQRELAELPLDGWKELLLAVNGVVDRDSLKEVLINKVNIIEENKSFTYKGETSWWNKNERAGLLNMANSWPIGTPLSVIINGKKFEMAPETLKTMLSLIEVYSALTFVNTNEHITKIKMLPTMEDVLNYDYTTGYPNKVIID